jgi:adenosylcobinamide-GDP ribazoletransferase
MVPIIVAFQFLTIMPALIQRRFTAQEMGRAVGWFPLVGLALGLVLYGVNYVADLFFPANVATALTIFAWVAFTRAFHLDGFMDTCDGLFGGFTPERRLEIMKDSRLGAFGAAGGILILLLKYSALASMSASDMCGAMVLATTLGRWTSPLVIFAFPYAREEGLGIEMKRNVCWIEVIIATIIALSVCLIFQGWLGLVLMLVAALTAFLLALFIMHLLPGLTGDTYGAVTEMVEAIILILFTIQIFR